MKTKPKFFVESVHLISRLKDPDARIDVTCISDEHTRCKKMKSKSETVVLELTLRSIGNTLKVSDESILNHFYKKSIKCKKDSFPISSQALLNLSKQIKKEDGSKENEAVYNLVNRIDDYITQLKMGRDSGCTEGAKMIYDRGIYKLSRILKDYKDDLYEERLKNAVYNK